MPRREQVRDVILQHLYVPTLIACECGHDYKVDARRESDWTDVAEHLADVIVDNFDIIGTVQ